MANQSEQRGGSGNFANDPKRGPEAGKKGTEHAHGASRQQEQATDRDKRQQGSHDKEMSAREMGSKDMGSKGGQR